MSPPSGGAEDVEHADASLLRALVDVVERWRTHGPAN